MLPDLHHIHFVLQGYRIELRLLYLEYDIGMRIQFLDIILYPGSNRGVILVSNIRTLACSMLDNNFHAHLCHLRDCFRNHGDTVFATQYLFRNTYYKILLTHFTIHF